MSQFDEQLRQRENSDNADFADAIGSIADAVMGEHLQNALSDIEAADSAIDEILKRFHCKPVKTARKAPDDQVPQDITVQEQLENRLRPYGIKSRPVTLDDGWYHNAVGAMLGTLKEDGSVIALIPDKLTGYRYFDAKTGRKVKVTKRTQRLIGKEALCFYQPLPQKALKVPDLIKFMLDQLAVSDVVIYLLLMGAAAALGLLTPLFSKWLFGEVLDSQSLQILLALATFMISFSLSRLCFTSYQTLFNSRLSIKQDVAVQAAVMSRMMSLPPSFFKQYAAGELNQLASYVQSLCSTLFNAIGVTGLTSLFSLIYIGQIFGFAPSLVIPSLIVILLTLAVSLAITFKQMKITRQRMAQAAKTSGMTYALITGIQKIKLAGAEKRMFSRWARQYAKEAELQYNPPMFLKLGSTISMTVSLFGTLAIYAVAAFNSVGVADYYAFNAAYGMVSSAFMSVTSIAATMANIRPILEMARPIMEAEPEMKEGKEIVTELKGGITLTDVSFRYDEMMADVIDDLSLTIEPGEYLAIVGPTGCGKSTLIRLLLGFEKPYKGTIFFDHKNIEKVDLESLRKKIGLVMQNGKLFQGDIYSNIVISAPQLTLDEAWAAAETASIADDIRAMPMGMNTIISEGQGGISGGQRQRLMIARAIAPKPKILIFDEATSALDNVTQKKVSDAIDSLNCTRIVIAHRLSTIRHADRIVYLDKGHIMEDGTYDELIAKDGLFAELVKRQRLDYDC